ncbi:PIN/TRAM domain-containing protein [Anaerococcus sp. Marseille-P3625]|uniref:PIN/TRAM domain-containing protein n=1 Tax=Anaerococcus sp. Marseille-P3625 TaxID=1977277 RepID=UPI000C08445A|nr:PIN domain-containing protein [Anaerococcus sp. Marseille-P3625]
MKRIFQLVITLIGIVLGIVIFNIVNAASSFIEQRGIIFIIANVLAGLVGGIIFYFISGKFAGKFINKFSNLEGQMSEIPASKLIVGTIGAIIGIVIATLISRPLTSLQVPYVGNSIFVLLSILLYIVFGYLGWRVSVRNSEDFLNLFKNVKDVKEQKSILKHDKNKNLATAKILDTSVIIDGRIVDILNTEFIEGDLIISEFVLEELQHIADSPDDLKRERGRRGLDIVNEIKNNEKTNLVIVNTDYPEIKEVDSKLLKLAIDLNGKIFTNDYNLNKVCDVQGIPVLNINDLANALKPVVLPGESMEIEVIKLGKGRNQGVGYLEDGTMVVVEDGDKYLDKTITATVTSVLQTSAGRMIFVKSKED